MRFEEKDFTEQLKTLRRLHKYLNKEIFENVISEDIVIDICNINKDEREEKFDALFRREHIVFDTKTMTISSKEAILFDNQIISDISRLKTQTMQVYILGQIMLHEMIHQYCYENGLDDVNHGGQWKETAKKFNLMSNYENGKYISEKLTQTGNFIISCFRLR